jgi:histone acetyltransferase SAS3
MHIEHNQELDVVQGDISLENQLLVDDVAGSDIDAEGEDDMEINTSTETHAAIKTVERKIEDEEDDDEDEAAVESPSSVKSESDEDDHSEESSETDAENEWEAETDAAEEVDAGNLDPNKCM